MEEDADVLVTVLATGNPALIALAKSLLEDADIPYVTKGEILQDLIKPGRFGLGYNQVIGPVEFQVRQEDEEDARELLADLEEGDMAEE